MSERVEQLLQAGNEASGRVRNLWITFLLFGTYLAIAIGGTTHRQMLLEAPIVLPILGAELPLVQFYQIAPGLFLVFHFYLLVQLYLLAQKLHRLESHMENDLQPGEARRHIRDQTDNFLITQLLVGRQRIWLVRAFVWLAAWLTMVLAPVVLLLAFQIRFLPYHDVFTTWVQRIIVIADLGLIWLLWPAVVSRDGGLGGAVVEIMWKPWLRLYEAIRYTAKAAADQHRPGQLSTYVDLAVGGLTLTRRFWRTIVGNLFWAAVTVIASVSVIGFSVLVATIPAEEMERWVLTHKAGATGEDGKAADKSWRWEFWELNERRADGEASLWQLFAWQTWAMKRPRERPVPELSEPNAVWWPTAILFEGEPDRASAQTSSLFSRNLVLIDDIDLVTLNDDELAKVDRTLVLRGRDLRYARFDRADLRKADLFEADLGGATLHQTRLGGADLTGAELQWTDLRGAELQGADLDWAGMWATIVDNADLTLAGTYGVDEADPFTDPYPGGRAENAEAAITAWLEDIPAGNTRDRAARQLAILREPSRGLASWRPWAGARNRTLPEQWTAREEEALGAYLGKLGCEPGGASNVARGLLRRMVLERQSFRVGEHSYHPILAKALLAPDCAGAEGLTDEERVSLRTMASSNQ